MVIERPRNRAEDLRAYHLEYWDRSWPKDERAAPDRGAGDQSAKACDSSFHLTDDAKAAAMGIIRFHVQPVATGK